MFATDIDANALSVAATGLYPATVEEELVDASWRERFQRAGDQFQVTKRTRGRVLFSRHDIVEDPPFLRLDFVSCRNLLIYLKQSVQDRVLRTLAGALNSDGFLWLGSSESLGPVADSFQVVDTRARIFRALSGRSRPLVVPDARTFAHRRAPSRPQPERSRLVSGLTRALTGYAPPTLILDKDLQLLYRYGDLSELLSLPVGAPSLDARDLLPSDLSAIISTSLSRLKKSGNEDVVFKNLHVTKPDGTAASVTMRMRLLADGPSDNDLLALIFEELGQPPAEEVVIDAGEMPEELHELFEQSRRELAETRANLQTTIEQLETSNEELQSTNEELLAANEELQSTNEELQSVNEELHTVNQEHQAKVGELTDLTDEFDDVLAATDVGVLVVDRQLHITRFNPAVTRFVNVLPQDVGRPLAHITPKLGTLSLYDDAAHALQSRDRFTVVHTDGPRMCMVQGRPRFSGDVIEGLVLTFTDVSNLVAAERDAELLSTALSHSGLSVGVIERSGVIVAFNEQLAQCAKRDPRHLKGTNLLSLSPADEHERLRGALQAAADGAPWRGIVCCEAPDGALSWEVVELFRGEGERAKQTVVRLSRRFDPADFSASAGTLTEEAGQTIQREYWMWHAGEDKIHFTRGLPQMWGLPRDAISLDGFNTKLSKEEADRLQEQVASALNTRTSVVARVRLLEHPEGTTQLVLLMQPREAPTGEIYLVGETRRVVPDSVGAGDG